MAFADLIGNSASQSNCSGICFPQYNKNIIGTIESISDTTVVIDIAQIVNLIGTANSISNTLGNIDAVDGKELEAIGNIMYADAIDSILSGNISLTSSPLKLMLLTRDYVPHALHTYNDIILYNAEAVGEGYVTGGQAIDNVTIQNGKLHADNVHWNNTTLTHIRWALLYVDNGSIINNKAIAVFDFGRSRSVTNSIFSVVWGVYGKSYGNILQVAQREIPKLQNFITA